MTSKLSIEAILAESDREVTRFEWEGTFADYLRMVIRTPSLSRLSHALVHDAIVAEGTNTPPNREPVYELFEGEIFGLERHLHTIVQYFAAGAQRLEVRKRILLLLGPPASGKSTVVDLIKRAVERYTRTDAGAVYAIRGCPMQEEPLHLVPDHVRETLQQQYGIYVEGDLCPRCLHLLRTEYKGKAAEMPVERVVVDEREAMGIGHYLATNANPADASRLVGSIDESEMNGEDRREIAAKAFRLDGELNIANRGIMEFVEMFKADRHMLNALLDLAQGQVIKNLRFGSVYADEAIIGHSNEGDFDSFVAEVTSEALRDRIIAVQVPYNLRVQEEVKIYQKMMRNSKLEDVHLAPLTLPVASTFAALTRLESPYKQGMSLLDKLHLYDGQMVTPYTDQDLREIQRHHPAEGMQGISPRYVMNRIGAVASLPEISCISPLAALDSLWRGLGENVSLEQMETFARYVAIVAETVKEYSDLAIQEVQRAYDESFEESANMLLETYLANIDAFTNGTAPGDSRDSTAAATERDMREIERPIGVKEMNKGEFREEINRTVSAWKQRGWSFTYASEPRLKVAIETRLFPARRQVERGLSQPRFARQRVEWSQRRSAIKNRLESSYGYCNDCSEDLIDYAAHVIRNKAAVKTPKGEGVEWAWPLYPKAADSSQNSS